MVIVTDCMYRSAIAAIYSLNKLGEEIIAVTTDLSPDPPAFHSKYIKEKVVLSSDAKKYRDELLELCKKHLRSVILPIGVLTLNIISDNIGTFNEVADFCVAEKTVLDKLNDKKQSKEAARCNRIKVPCNTDTFPKVVKPFCGEKFGLKASDRYRIVYNNEELKKATEYFSKYDTAPLTEEYIEGYGVGVSVVIGKDGVERSAFCHKRLYEYPASGGPSSLLETFYDENIIRKTMNLLKSEGFVGIAMAEFKVRNGEYYFLEINPRIWGSFGATYKTDSDFLRGYLAGARGIESKFEPKYKIRKIKFVPNIFASSVSYFKKKNIKKGFGALWSAFNPLVPNAIFSFKDPTPAIRDIFRKRR